MRIHCRSRRYTKIPSLPGQKTRLLTEQEADELLSRVKLERRRRECADNDIELLPIAPKKSRRSVV